LKVINYDILQVAVITETSLKNDFLQLSKMIGAKLMIVACMLYNSCIQEIHYKAYYVSWVIYQIKGM